MFFRVFLRKNADAAKIWKFWSFHQIDRIKLCFCGKFQVYCFYENRIRTRTSCNFSSHNKWLLGFLCKGAKQRSSSTCNTHANIFTVYRIDMKLILDRVDKLKQLVRALQSSALIIIYTKWFDQTRLYRRIPKVRGTLLNSDLAG